MNTEIKRGMNIRVEKVRRELIPQLSACPFCGSEFEMKIKKISERVSNARIAFFQCPACGTKSKDFFITHDSIMFPDVMDNYLGDILRDDDLRDDDE